MRRKVIYLSGPLVGRHRRKLSERGKMSIILIPDDYYTHLSLMTGASLYILPNVVKICAFPRIILIFAAIVPKEEEK